jgi:hypothetical protein
MIISRKKQILTWIVLLWAAALAVPNSLAFVDYISTKIWPPVGFYPYIPSYFLAYFITLPIASGVIIWQQINTLRRLPQSFFHTFISAVFISISYFVPLVMNLRAGFGHFMQYDLLLPMLFWLIVACASYKQRVDSKISGE